MYLTFKAEAVPFLTSVGMAFQNTFEWVSGAAFINKTKKKKKNFCPQAAYRLMGRADTEISFSQMRKELQLNLNQVLWGQIKEAWNSAWREVCGRMADRKTSPTGWSGGDPDVSVSGGFSVSLPWVCLSA